MFQSQKGECKSFGLETFLVEERSKSAALSALEGTISEKVKRQTVIEKSAGCVTNKM